MINLAVNIKSEDSFYPIYIDNDDISLLKEKALTHLKGEKYLVVISEKVYRLYGKTLGFEKENIFVLKDGEKEKNFNNYKKILEHALKMQLTRKDAIIAIGGGVVGDLAGFAASTYMRGIDFIQIPTTLLACVDSSVGGKTGIDTGSGKNLIGSFYQPKAVFINTNFLKSLDERQFKTGLGEVVKYAFIEKSCRCEDFNLTNFLNENSEKIRDTKILNELIRICVSLKISVVEKDEKEGSLRRILNFGHTYGHAIEKITKYRKYTHGEAVVEGMRYAFKLAVKKGIIDKNYEFYAQDIFKKFQFAQIPSFNSDKMIDIMKLDKKASSNKITFVLPTDYSTVGIYDFTVQELEELSGGKVS